MSLNERQSKRLEMIKEELVNTCTECGGTGYKSEGMCDCMIILRYLMQLVKSNIPENYWELSLDNLKVNKGYKNLVLKMTTNIEKAVVRSLGLIFLGPNGVGKSSLLCEIGKRAIVSKFQDSVLYITAKQFMDSQYDRQESKVNDFCTLDTINSSSVLLLDELDKVYIKKESDFVIRTLEDFFRDSLSKGRSIITASNWTLEDIQDVFGESFVSLINRNTRIVEFSGDDYSVERQDNWLEMLERDIDYYAEDIITMSRRLHKRMQREEFGE